jgi:aspartate/methionine/tyrosine aminotransferase
MVKIEPFLVEKWLNKYEKDVEINISETCVKPFKIKEFLKLMGNANFFEEFGDTQLTYGHILGSPSLRRGIARLYYNLTPENILVTGGAIGANFLVFYSLVEPGDTVISIFPAYQQLYSVAKSFGANVKLLKLDPEKRWLLPPDELAEMVDDRTKLIVINNPHNPTGSLMEKNILEEICGIAEDAGAYLLNDESYSGSYVNPEKPVPSTADLSQNAITTGSMSKAFSLTGLRLGWIAANQKIISECEDHREYTTISNGMIDDALASLAVRKVKLIRERNQKIINTNYRILSNWVENEPMIDWVPPKAGTIAFLRLKTNVSSEEICLRLLKEKQTLLVPGSCFQMDQYIRIGWGGEAEELIEGLTRFKGILNSYR